MDGAILGIIVGITAMMVMIIKTRIPVALAMVLSCLIMGLFAGMAPTELVNAIKSGFGGVLGGIGLIIAFGVIMGACFEKSGAAVRMAKTFVKICGKGREDLALGFTGVLVAIPVFCDSAYVLLHSLVRAISRNTGKSAVGLGVTLALGLLITHALVPPTPGPVAVSGILGVDLGVYMLWGLAVSIPMMMLSLIYIRKVGKQYYRVPNGENWITSEADWANLENVKETKDEDLPSNFLSFGPILVPIALILANTMIGEGSSFFHTFLQLVGNPVVAVGIGVLMALYGLTTQIDRKEMIGSMDDALSTTGLILVVTGCGGAMGAVLKASGAGPQVAEVIASSGIPPLLVPLAIASMLRLIQGSATASMMVAATMTLPLVETLGLDPVFVALACAVGPVGFSHLNDSYFHIISRTLGITELSDQLKIWSLTSTIAWAIGASIIMTLNLFFGKGGTLIDPIIPLAVLGAIVVWMKTRQGEAPKEVAA
ncbi:GntP family permease [Photobacterium rosenbergii]|uniref:Gluconate permease n=1 Tax=Photobacterium rosenbergii TaxID=294936 RepID=A0A2T3NJF0_9GAMM|nr:SLC13 family permease [Photobacterium rosenbergii]MBY5946216.1 GntP family permease [Photobacterium rosenbergii]PSW15647.1 gluconate permease [Photobacterium rosenbergii]